MIKANMLHRSSTSINMASELAKSRAQECALVKLCTLLIVGSVHRASRVWSDNGCMLTAIYQPFDTFGASRGIEYGCGRAHYHQREARQ